MYFLTAVIWCVCNVTFFCQCILNPYEWGDLFEMFAFNASVPNFFPLNNIHSVSSLLTLMCVAAFGRLYMQG